MEHLPSPNVLFFAKAAGAWALGEEQLTGFQGLLQSPGSCRGQERMDTARQGVGMNNTQP